jgi:cyclophilin family peptidyl-prolyl cis-trans isomerase
MRIALERDQGSAGKTPSATVNSSAPPKSPFRDGRRFYVVLSRPGDPTSTCTIGRVSTAVLTTNKGPIELELFDEDAPNTVENFVKLSQDGFYDGVVFHRVIDDFMIQGGDPTGTGMGGPGYQFDDEANDRRVERGAIAMANSGPNTNGSQFFIVTAEACPWLDGKHTVFGRVSSGMDVVDEIGGSPTGPGDRPLDEIRIESVSVSD